MMSRKERKSVLNKKTGPVGVHAAVHVARVTSLMVEW